MIFLLAPLSLIYYAGLILDRALKTIRRQTLPRPVVSVGNIAMGGTGKTPLVSKLLFDLKKWGFHPAVLTRGYKSKNGFSDEAALLRKIHPDVPVGVGADRARSARGLLSQHLIDVFVLDDGFQHWALRRDLDIVCVDGTVVNDHLLPWGRLREPQSALRRAHLVVVTRLELLTDENRRRLFSKLSADVSAGNLLSSAFGTIVRQWKTGANLPLGSLKGKKLIALSAVGRPQAFEEGLQKTGATVVPLRFRDHHVYTERDLNTIEEKAKKEKADVITTEKDMVKLERTRWGRAAEFGFQVFVAVVHHDFEDADEDKWKRALMSVIKK